MVNTESRYNRIQYFKDTLLKMFYSIFSGLIIIFVLKLYSSKSGISLSCINLISQSFPFYVDTPFHGCQIIIELVVVSMIIISIIKIVRLIISVLMD